MKCWSARSRAIIDAPAEYERFLSELISLCEKHGIWLSHEDHQGGFELTKKSTIGWLAAASLDDGDDST